MELNKNQIERQDFAESIQYLILTKIKSGF